MAPTHITIPYKPRPFQKQFHENARRWNVAVCHRRAGKTYMAVHWLIRGLVECPHPNPIGCYIAPTFSQAERIAFEYVRQATEMFPGVKYNKAKLRVEIPIGDRNKITIHLLSGSNDSSEQIRGLALDQVIFDEYADIPAKVFPQIVRPALADRRGNCLWIGTPKGDDAFKAIYDKAVKEVAAENPDWHCVYLPADKTNSLTKAELNELRDQMSDNEYRAELLCDWGAHITGAYYGEQLSKAEAEGRIGNIPHDETMLVNTSWDLGVRDKTTIIFWQESAGASIRLIDCYQASGEGLAHYVQVLQQRAFDKGYGYGDHLFPHDTDTRVLAATAQRRSDILRQLGIMPTIVPMRKVAEGIEAVRAILPRTWIDEENCKEALSALKQYRVKESSGLPLHDVNSHFADAMRYLAIGYREGMSSFGSYRKPWDQPLEYENPAQFV